MTVSGASMLGQCCLRRVRGDRNAPAFWLSGTLHCLVPLVLQRQTCCVFLHTCRRAACLQPVSWRGATQQHSSSNPSPSNLLPMGRQAHIRPTTRRSWSVCVLGTPSSRDSGRSVRSPRVHHTPSSTMRQVLQGTASRLRTRPSLVSERGLHCSSVCAFCLELGGQAAELGRPGALQPVANASL
jgi:hypothetical protein